ncbi:MAG TPA: hypothetical protein VFD84_07960 [Candidatus Binatia bacterium]|nr:hypothetical protein [Candidatus Binatia bacterium]
MRTRLGILVLLSALGAARISAAGWCGCEKEPPDLAAVRPPFAWPAGWARRDPGTPSATFRPGGQIIIFADDAHPLDPTKKYRVRFLRIDERDLLAASRRVYFENWGLPLDMDARSARPFHLHTDLACGSPSPLRARAPVVAPVLARDQADSREKWQLRVQLPMLSYGPKRIVVEEADSCTVWRTIDESQFTVIGQEIQLRPSVPAFDRVTKAPLLDPDGRPLLKAVYEGPYPTGVSGVGDSPSLERWAYLALDVSEIRGLRDAPGTTTPGWSQGWGYDLEGYAVSAPGLIDVLALTGWNAQGWRFSALDQVIDLSQADPTTFFAKTMEVHVCAQNPTVECTTDADCAVGVCRTRDRRVSDGIVYWKHEFNTWADAHAPGGKYEFDSRDPAYWHRHANPTAAHPRYAEQHADFDHLVVALKLRRENGRRMKSTLKPFSIHIEAVPRARHDTFSIDPGAGSGARSKPDR